MKRVLAGAFAGLLFTSGAALAQQAAAPAADAAPGKPEVKTVGDWLVRCFPVQSISPCDIFQELDNKDTHQRVLSLSIAYIPSMNRHGLVLTVPLEISIPRGVTIQTDSYTSPVLKYRMCNREGCFVQMVADNAMVEALSRSGPVARVTIVADSGKTYPIGLSLKGFAAARDSMMEQAKAKAKPAAKTGDTAPAPTP